MLRVRETNGPSQTPTAQTAAPQTAMEAVGAGVPKLLDRVREALHISGIMVMKRLDIITSCADRKPSLPIICGSS